MVFPKPIQPQFARRRTREILCDIMVFDSLDRNRTINFSSSNVLIKKLNHTCSISHWHQILLITRKRNIVSSSTPHEGGKRIGNPQNQTYQQYFALDLQNLVFPATITQRNPFRYNFRVSQQSTIQAHIKIDAGDEML